MNFNVKTAETCVYAARQMAMLFPEQPDTGFIYSQGPWWDVVHISEFYVPHITQTLLTRIATVMQTMAVLLLEMAYEGQRLKDEKADILACIKKMIRWLRAMQANDPVASRAHDVVYKILNTCAPGLRDQVKELIADDQPFPSQPPVRSEEPTAPPQSEHWGTTGGGSYPGRTSQEYPPPLMEGQFANPLYPYPVPDHQSMTFAFGNPFITSFDQGAPIIDMQNLWWQPPPSGNLSLDPSDMVLSQQQLMQQQMQQQMQQDTEAVGWAEQPGHDERFDSAPC